MYPNNGDAWEGLLRAMVQMPDSAAKAVTALQRMPPELYDAGLRKPSFLRSLALVYAGMKRYDLADSLLQRAEQRETEGGGTVSLSTQLQQAAVWTEAGKAGNAQALLQRLVDQSPNTPGIWKAWISNLHAQKKDDLALSEIRQIPAELVVPLSRDLSFVGLEAAVYTATGQAGDALQAVRSAIAECEIEKIPVPAALQVQFAWSLLADPDSQNELYTTLQATSARRDLDAAQRKEISEIWSTWIRRRAYAEVGAGNPDKGIAILRAGAQLLPDDTGVRSDLAGDLMAIGDTKSAFAIYRVWGLKNGTADDYSAAIGAAAAAQQKALGDQWLARALQLYPNNSKILTAAARQAVAMGDYKKAERYFLQAKSALAKEAAAMPQTAGLADSATSGIQAARALGELLLGSTAPASPQFPVTPRIPSDSLRPLLLTPQTERKAQPPAQPSSTDPLFSPVTLRNPEPAQLRVDPAIYRNGSAGPASEIEYLLQRTRASEPQSEATLQTESSPALQYPAPANTTLAAAPQQPRTAQEEIDDQLALLESRDTPYFNAGAVVQGRSGTGGFDRLSGEESTLEASTTVNNTARLSLFLRPIFLDSGTPDGSSTLRFGTLPGGVVPAEISQSGLAADVQFSSKTLGLRFGSTPLEFMVRNWLGGLRLRPGNGPITIIFNRDSVKDTMLSYAGARDPLTKQVWGGVMASGVQIVGNWGGAKSGVYFNAGYQYIDGKRVKNNTRLDGTAGTYYQFIARPEGTLTAGLNFSAMHYANNLRYFTLGQGGYFSPQEYFLFNVPVRWDGAWRQVRYSLAGSIGAQHFRENASPYFPANFALQGFNGLYYPGLADIGPNFSLEMRADYRFSPNWTLSFFANVNNARDYTSETAGLSVRYLIKPRPLVDDLGIPSLPDWKGARIPGLP